MIRIAAVDDEIHVLERFERMVLKNNDLELCGLFESGAQLLSYLKEYQLDAVFLDIEMPGVNGLQLSEQVQNLCEDIDILLIEQLIQRGYMEGNGYTWAIPRAGELNETCTRVMEGFKK